MRQGRNARARSLRSPTAVGCAAGGATPPRPRAAPLQPSLPLLLRGPGALPPGTGRPQVRVQGSGPRRLGLREMVRGRTLGSPGERSIGVQMHRSGGTAAVPEPWGGCTGARMPGSRGVQLSRTLGIPRERSIRGLWIAIHPRSFCLLPGLSSTSRGPSPMPGMKFSGKEEIYWCRRRQ